jgi:hypothetical protein
MDEIGVNSLYIINNLEMDLIYLGVEDSDESLNYVELKIDYVYSDEQGDTMVQAVAPLAMDMEALINLSAMCSAAMCRLQDANPLEFSTDDDEEIF